MTTTTVVVMLMTMQSVAESCPGGCTLTLTEEAGRCRWPPAIKPRPLPPPTRPPTTSIPLLLLLLASTYSSPTYHQERGSSHRQCLPVGQKCLGCALLTSCAPWQTDGPTWLQQAQAGQAGRREGGRQKLPAAAKKRVAAVALSQHPLTLLLLRLKTFDTQPPEM